jgi:hypothetical protein
MEGVLAPTKPPKEVNGGFRLKLTLSAAATEYRKEFSISPEVFLFFSVGSDPIIN